MLVLTALMGGCSAPSPSSEQVSLGIESPASVTGPLKENPSTSQGKSEMPALENILTVFSSKDGASWESFNNIKSVQWRDPAPVQDSEAIGTRSSHTRSGNILLAGFGMVDSPNGKAGVEANSKRDNEGNSGITLSGDGNHVESISITKFHMSDNYQEILQWQLSDVAIVKPIADKCSFDFGTTADNTQNNTFYEISFAPGNAVYAEAYLEEGGKNSPGSTIFDFYRDQPTQRISAMRCQETEKN